MEMKHYFRTADQDQSLGLNPEQSLFKDDRETNYKSLLDGKGFGAVKSALTAPDTTTATTITTATSGTSGNSASGATSATTETTNQVGGGTEVGEEGHIREEVGDDERFTRLGRTEAISIPSDCPSCM